MNNRLVIQRLWWKELRQLVPMLIMLPTIAAVLLLLYWITNETDHHSWPAGVVVFLGMPGLFAVGAGALLVGQEKESRTILWLSSLPIRSQTIVRIKTAAAVLGLAVLWFISGIYFLSRERFESPMSDVEHFWVWPANSLFLLFAGFALAWKNKSALVALLLVVPIAIVPYVLAVLVHRTLAVGNGIERDPSAATVISVQLVCSVIALVAADWIGCRALLPEWVKAKRVKHAQESTGNLRSDSFSASYGATQSPLPALIWQFAKQSRALLIGASVMLIVASSFSFLTSVGSRPPAPDALAVLLGYLGVSWLGVSVFQSDSSHQRIRFLADRGISPRLVWVTRQVVPITIIVTILLGSLLLATLVNPLRLQASSNLSVMALLTMALLFVIFSFSQWVGQVITSPIVSMVTAPLLSLIPFGAYSFATGTLGAPILLVVVAAMLPFAATYFSTRRWMDRRFGMRYWCTQAGYAALIFLLPALPHMFALVREPGMSRQVRVQVNSVTANSLAYNQTPIELVLNKDVDKNQNFVSFVQSWNNQLDSVERQLDANSNPVGASSQHVVRKLVTILLLSEMSITRSDATNTEEQQLLYRRSMSMLSDIVVRMRLSPRIIDQDFADLVEIVLLQQMDAQHAAALLGDERYTLIARRLADKPGRRQARIRAVALSWLEYEQRATANRFPPVEIGGYALSDGGDGWNVVSGTALMNRRVSRRIENLWKLANFTGNDVPREMLADVANDWGKPLMQYGIEPKGGSYQFGDSNFSLSNMFTLPMPIASRWHGEWETQALTLLSK